ncbi:hypothetical protein Glove_173g35 [Diversispora epigaea]|uniref:Uncharacterized protein n=1 Tax=Diversispora epigaea TaxID=1348612 RepID=A0A397IY23_9GLOM|nr:hypothetical protein Glove_173g35 [Diversispora epigaea]
MPDISQNATIKDIIISAIHAQLNADWNFKLIPYDEFQGIKQKAIYYVLKFGILEIDNGKERY